MVRAEPCAGATSALAVDTVGRWDDSAGMDRVSPLPSNGTVFFDPRDPARSLRVSYHEEQAVFVLSQWRGSDCLATFQLAVDEVPRLVYELTRSLANGAASSRLDETG
jgi:hypothetical protein